MNKRLLLTSLWSLLALFFLLRLNVLSLDTHGFSPYLELDSTAETATYTGTWFRFPLAPESIQLSVDDENVENFV